MASLDMVYNFLTKAYESGSHQAYALLSDPGVGKTTIINRIAEEHGKKAVVVLCSQCDPSEVAGATWKSDKGDFLVDFDPAWSNGLEDGDILFFDEFLTAPEQVQNAVLTMVLDRKYKSGRPMPDVKIIAAANPLASANAVPAAVRGRFIWITVRQDKDDWIKYMTKKYPFLDRSTAESLALTIDAKTSWYNNYTWRRAEEIVKVAMAFKDSGLSASQINTVLSSTDGPMIEQKLKEIWSDMDTETERVAHRQEVEESNTKTVLTATKESLADIGIHVDFQTVDELGRFLLDMRDSDPDEFESVMEVVSKLEVEIAQA